MIRSQLKKIGSTVEVVVLPNPVRLPLYTPEERPPDDFELLEVAEHSLAVGVIAGGFGW